MESTVLNMGYKYQGSSDQVRLLISSVQYSTCCNACKWSRGVAPSYIEDVFFLINPFREPSPGHPALQTHEHSPPPHIGSKLIPPASRAPTLKSHPGHCSLTLPLVGTGGRGENWGHSIEREISCQQEGEFLGEFCPQL